jgi:nucleoside-diphosphate-sugar epimerase
MGNYLLTGVAGFIACRVAELLLDEGHTVVGVDNLNDAYDVRLKEYRLARLKSRPRFIFHKLDISDHEAFNQQQVFGSPKTMPLRSEINNQQFDAVINLAARAGVRQAVINPWVYVDTNMTGTLNLLDFCQRQGIRKFILASTSSLYGADAPLPTPEDASSDRPLQPYAASKKGAEALCHAYHHLYGIDVTIFRYFTVYGPAGRPDMSIFRFIQWISEGHPVRLTGDGNQARGFTYVDDIARGTILGLKPLGFEIINLGGHECVKMIELIRLMEQVIGREAHIEHLPVNPADMWANWADVEKAGRLLGWEPRISLRTGVERCVEWYNAEREWASKVITD